MVRSYSKISESEEDRQYYEKVSNASLGMVEDIKFTSGKSVLTDALNVLKDLNLSPTKLPLQHDKESPEKAPISPLNKLFLNNGESSNFDEAVA